ncbi:MAG: uroporphyrinogen-III synthase [Bacteroidota bacterium]
MISILSTKVLTPAQKNLLIHSGLAFVEYPAITTEYLDVAIHSRPYDYCVFTSQQGVKAYINYVNNPDANDQLEYGIKAFCVGEKTRSLLREHAIEVVATGKNATALGEIISSTYNNYSFLLLSGNLRRDELPDILKKNTIKYKEILVYRTLLNPKKITSQFEGILFFSPSGVESFHKQNTLKGATAFCIGETTASALKKYTDKIIIASKPTVENVIVKAVNHFATYD